MPTKITYNGKTTEVSAGDIATITCKDYKMATDVVVEAPESEGEIAKLYSIEVTPTKAIQNVLPEGDYDGFNEVIVNPIPDEYVIPNLQEKTATENGEVTADEGYTGLSKVTVNVPSEEPNLISKTVTENGTYKASEEVDDSTIVGTWVFNDTLVYENLGLTSGGSFAIDAIFGNGKNIDRLYPYKISSSGDYIASYHSVGAGSTTTPYFYNYSDNVWSSEDYKTITINSEVNDTLEAWIKANATKTSGGATVDGYSEVIVNVVSEEPILEEITITENGEYIPSGDGYSKVTVNVEQGIDTSDATATADKILKDETAYVNGEKVTGSIETYEGANSVAARQDVTGTWRFNSTLTPPPENVQFAMNNSAEIAFTVDGGAFGGNYWKMLYRVSDNALVYFVHHEGDSSAGDGFDAYANGNFKSSKHQTVTFVQGAASAGFVAWLEVNATKIADEPTMVLPATSPNGIILTTEGKYVDKPIKVVPTLEAKSVTPTAEAQVVATSDGYVGMSAVVVEPYAPIPIEVATEAEMTALLTSGEVGGVYKYTGTTGTYENGALYVLEAELITFTIDGTEYQAEDGMTWAEWVESEYNTGGFTVINTTTVINQSENAVQYSSNSTDVKATELILNDGTYQISVGGSYD